LTIRGISWKGELLLEHVEHSEHFTSYSKEPLNSESTSVLTSGLSDLENLSSIYDRKSLQNLQVGNEIAFTQGRKSIVLLGILLESSLNVKQVSNLVRGDPLLHAELKLGKQLLELKTNRLFRVLRKKKVEW